MRYKAGDRVVIKTWEELEKEYGLNENNEIEFKRKEYYPIFKKRREEWIESKNTRIFTIKIINDFNDYYLIKEDNDIWGWAEEMIECLEEEYVPPTPIRNRFELLDL